MFGWYNVQISTSDCNQKAKTYLEPAVFHTYMYIYVVYLDIMCVYIYTRVYIYIADSIYLHFEVFFDHLHFPSPPVDPPGSTTAPTDESPISPGGDTARNDGNEIHMLLDDTM